MDVKVLAVIIGALLGGAISAASFYFRNRREVREKVNESLFQLLEVWSLIAMIRVVGSKKFHSMLVSRIKDKFPYENVGENEEKSIRDGMIKALPFLTGMGEGRFDSRFINKYKKSVNELAKIYPLLAFNLNRNQMLIQFLGAFDKLASSLPTSESDMAILENARNFMLSESFEELESDLIVLASSSGYRNKKETKLYIKRIKNRLDGMPQEIFDAYIENVISPAVQAYYDRLGIPNPNGMEKESNKAMHATNTW